MNIQKIIGTAFLVCGLCYAFFIGRGILRSKDKMKEEQGSLPLLMGLEFVIYFLCTLGVSDFLLNTLTVKRLKAGNSVDWSTLILWMICLALGGIFGARAVDHMNGAVIKKVMGIALVFSLAALVIKMIVTSGASGEATGLRFGFFSRSSSYLSLELPISRNALMKLSSQPLLS